jgi:hypothetical protein
MILSGTQDRDVIDARLRRLPPIRRARFWRLYAQDGRRFLDLWQDGGRGILGARHQGLGRSIKATLDRGLDRPLPSVLEARLGKALLRLVPRAKALRLFGSEEEALEALAAFATELPEAGSRYPETESGPRAGESILPDRGYRTGYATSNSERASVRQGGGLLESSLLRDPARSAAHASDDAATVLLLRPFSRWLPAREGEPAITIPLLPLARGFAPVALLFADPATAAKVGPGRLLPPLVLAAALEALAALSAYESATTEAHWARMDRKSSHLFERSGPWLFSRTAGADWDRVFDEALAKGILLSPDPGLPSLVPGDFDDGEIAPLSSIRS